MEGTFSVVADQLYRRFAAVSRAERDAGPLAQKARIAFLRNITIEGIETFLKQSLFARNIRPEIAFGGYGTMVQDILSAETPLGKHIADADLVGICLSLDELDPQYGAPGWHADGARAELESLLTLVLKGTRGIIAVNSFLLPLHPELGFVMAPDSSDATSQVAGLNRFIVECVRKNPSRLCLTDWNRYLALLGAEASLDERGRYLWKAPFKKAFLNLYARDLGRIVGALKGGTKKCLVLDCDNTLWGGVVGEDGIEGIKLDRNEWPGRAFHDFQTSLLHLVDRGVLLALCSKNNPEDVFEVLDSHPGCRLRRAHFAASRLNWKNKTQNLQELARELNLGLDSLVFVDDNPVECDQVRQLLPEVTVLQVPERLHELPRLLSQSDLFDGFATSAEDRMRSRLYAMETERKAERAQYSSVHDYLCSLNSVASIRRLRPADIGRVAQLSQKTNQFNLTTRRYSEQDIRNFLERDDAAVFTLSVRDRFGALGLVGAMVLERRGAMGQIDTLLLSCRALGRGLEMTLVAHSLQDIGRAWGISTWRAEYIPTRKNSQVEEFWSSAGFSLASENKGHKVYTCVAGSCSARVPDYIAVDED